MLLDDNLIETYGKPRAQVEEEIREAWGLMEEDDKKDEQEVSEDLTGRMDLDLL